MGCCAWFWGSLIRDFFCNIESCLLIACEPCRDGTGTPLPLHADVEPRPALKQCKARQRRTIQICATSWVRPTPFGPSTLYQPGGDSCTSSVTDSTAQVPTGLNALSNASQRFQDNALDASNEGLRFKYIVPGFCNNDSVGSIIQHLTLNQRRHVENRSLNEGVPRRKNDCLRSSFHTEITNLGK